MKSHRFRRVFPAGALELLGLSNLLSVHIFFNRFRCSPNGFAVGVLAVSRITRGVPLWSGWSVRTKAVFFYCFIVLEGIFLKEYVGLHGVEA